MAGNLTNTLNTCCSGHSRFQASETKMKKRGSWSHTSMCTTSLLWNCPVYQRAETDGNSAGNNIHKHITAPGRWAKIGEWKCVCWKIPLENFLTMLMHMHSCIQHAAVSQMTFYYEKNTLKSWHEMLRFLLDFRLVASTVHSKVLRSSMGMWLNIVIPRWKSGSSGVKPLPRQCPTRGNWGSKTQSVSLVSCSFLAPHLGDLLPVQVLGTDSHHFQVIFLGESS